MSFEVLCATMHQTDFSKIKEMNIQSNVVFANQADHTAYEEYEFDGHTAKMITTSTRGASMNRNIAIATASADVVIFADDDQIFVDGYERIVLDEFDKCPDADAIKFFVQSTNPERPLSYKKANTLKKATKRSIRSAGVHCLAIKRNFLLDNNIFFDVRIGPGRRIYCGEDSVFINLLIKHGAVVYHSPELVSYVKQEDSSWFHGHTEQFFISCGYIYGRIYGLLAPLACLRRGLRLKKQAKCDWGLFKMLGLMLRGVKLGRKAA